MKPLFMSFITLVCLLSSFIFLDSNLQAENKSFPWAPSYTTIADPSKHFYIPSSFFHTSRRETLPENFSILYSGSFDLNSMDQRSDAVSGIFNYSKNFYQTPNSLLYSNDLWGNRLERIKSLNNFFSTRLAFINLFSSLHGISFLTKEKIFTPIGYRETRIFVNDLLSRHSSKLRKINPDKNNDNGKRNVYIFIGTSATAPIIAFLESLQQNSNLINRSSFKRNLDRSVFVDIPYSFDLLKPHTDTPILNEEELFNHFSNYINPKIIEGNNLIFVDLAMSGLNIGSFMRNFKKFLIHSNVQEATLSSDIFTFLPYHLQNPFLRYLAAVPGMQVRTPWKYWHYIMKNLYASNYDDIFAYYDGLLNMGEDVVYSYDGDKLVYNHFNRMSIYRHRVNVGDYFVSPVEKAYLVDSKYSKDWIDYLRTNQIAPINPEYNNLKAQFSKVIENDLFFTASSPCIYLFGN